MFVVLQCCNVFNSDFRRARKHDHETLSFVSKTSKTNKGRRVKAKCRNDVKSGCFDMLFIIYYSVNFEDIGLEFCSHTY